MRTLMLTCFAILVTNTMPCLAQNPGGVDLGGMARESEDAAQGALVTLGKLVTEENAARMGFSGPGEAKQSKLDDPLVDFMIGLSELQRYQEGEDPAKLLVPTGAIIYPVGVGGANVSSITLKKQGDEWKPASFGSPRTAEAAGTARQNVLSKSQVAPSELFQVRIPALNLAFLGYMADQTLMFTPLHDFPGYGLEAGSTVPAKDVLLRLKPEAERHDGLPR